MMDKRLMVTGAALAVMIMAGVVMARLPQQIPAVPLQETVSDIEIEEVPVEDDDAPGYLYLLKEHEGRIAVFVPGQQEPEMILDVLVKYLPDYDRQLLAEGIAVDSYNQLVTLVEDFAS